MGVVLVDVRQTRPGRLVASGSARARTADSRGRAGPVPDRAPPGRATEPLTDGTFTTFSGAPSIHQRRRRWAFAAGLAAAGGWAARRAWRAARFFACSSGSRAGRGAYS